MEVRVVELVVGKRDDGACCCCCSRTCNDIVRAMPLVAQMQQALTLDMNVPIAEASLCTARITTQTAEG